MRFRLNIWQRGLLLGSAAVIGATVYYQFDRNGFDGYLWILPVVVAVGLAFLGLAPSAPAAGAPKSVASSSRGELYWHKTAPAEFRGPLNPNDWANLVRAVQHGATTIMEILPRKATTMRPISRAVPKSVTSADITSDATIRAMTFGYALAYASAFKLDPNFVGSPTGKRAPNILFDAVQQTWWGRLKRPPPEKPDPDHASVIECVSAGEVSSAVFMSMVSVGQRPFAQLFRHLEQDTLKSDEELEAKYGPTTRKLMREFEGA